MTSSKRGTHTVHMEVPRSRANIGVLYNLPCRDDIHPDSSGRLQLYHSSLSATFSSMHCILLVKRHRHQSPHRVFVVAMHGPCEACLDHRLRAQPRRPVKVHERSTGMASDVDAMAVTSPGRTEFYTVHELLSADASPIWTSPCMPRTKKALMRGMTQLPADL